MLTARSLAVVAAIMFTASATASAFAAESTDVTEMRRALRSIHTTERHLTRATGDFDGHRAKALDLVKQAEAEVRAALPPPPPRQPRTPTAAPPATGAPPAAGAPPATAAPPAPAAPAGQAPAAKP